MLLSAVLFLVRFNNFALTIGFYWSYMFLLKSPFLLQSWCDHNGTTTMLYRFIVTISMTAHIPYTLHKYSTPFASY